MAPAAAQNDDIDSAVDGATSMYGGYGGSLATGR
jgi:hypothetical protein